MPTFAQASAGAYEGKYVMMTIYDEQFCGILVEDVWEAGKQAAEFEARGGTAADKTYFDACVLGSDKTELMHLDREALAVAYNHILDTKFPLIDIGRHPSAPPELKAA